MDWNNVDLTSNYERDQPVLFGYTFEQLLLEISCNLKDINKETVKKHFNEVINDRMSEAKEIFSANLDNILNEAIKERNIE